MNVHEGKKYPIYKNDILCVLILLPRGFDMVNYVIQIPIGSTYLKNVDRIYFSKLSLNEKKTIIKDFCFKLSQVFFKLNRLFTKRFFDLFYFCCFQFPF